MNITTHNFSLQGKNAYITGAAQGIGAVVAHAFASAGANIAIVDRQEKTEETAYEIKKKYNVQSFVYITDITNQDDIVSLKNRLNKEFDTIDIAFNNAGIIDNAPSETMSYSAWSKVIETNLGGTLLTSQMATQLMIPQKKGSIINTASMSGHIVNIPQKQCAYNASKAGVIQLTKSLAVEWAQYNIRVNSISLGYIVTNLTKSLPPEWMETWKKQSVSRLGVPEDLIGILLYLASDASLFTTGSDFIIDGGFTCV